MQLLHGATHIISLDHLNHLIDLVVEELWGASSVSLFLFHTLDIIIIQLLHTKYVIESSSPQKLARLLTNQSEERKCPWNNLLSHLVAVQVINVHIKAIHCILQAEGCVFYTGRLLCIQTWRAF